MELLTGFLIGLLGSFHCVGMCGPIALALPRTKYPGTSRIIYNFGRITTYSLIGLLFGLLGSRLEMIGLQQIISITLGTFIIISLVTPRAFRNRISSALG